MPIPVFKTSTNPNSASWNGPTMTMAANRAPRMALNRVKMFARRMWASDREVGRCSSFPWPRSRRSSTSAVVSPVRSRSVTATHVPRVPLLRPLHHGGNGRSGAITGEQPLLVVAAGELPEDQEGAEHNGDDAGRIRPLVTLQEGRFGTGEDLVGLAGVLLGQVGGAGERLGQLSL